MAGVSPVVFSAPWFARHQRPLLALLNAPVIGGELRDALAIRRHDVGGDTRRRIVRMLPHAYIVANPDGTCTLDCRTHAKYAKRLRHQFAPIWRAMHEWDRFVATPLLPALDWGFNTLTTFPDPATGATTVDGRVTRGGVSETWATILAGAGNSNDAGAASDSIFRIVAAATSSQWQILSRSIFTFDTSPISAIGLITAATLSLFGTAKVDSLTVTPDVNLFGATPASTNALVNGDYGQCGATAYSSAIAFSAWSTSAYNDFALNATGISNLANTGISKFSTRNANFDVAAVAPTWSASPNEGSMGADMADQTGTANDPKLVVTFFINVPGAWSQAGTNSGMVGQMWM